MSKSVWLAVLLAMLLAGETLHGQSTFGRIVGTLRDPSGGAVAGANLELRNLDENTTSVTQSGASGLYEFLNVKPGKYQVTAERASFSAGKSPEIKLEARETRRADFTLEIAPRTETAVVTATVTQVQSENGTVADSKGFEQVTQLPINSRASTSSPFAAILTVPGVQQDRFGQLSIGGGLPAQIEYSVDGISTLHIASHTNTAELAPSSEMVQEFRVTSVSAGAAFGPMADVTVVSRSGNNQFHGSALWYHQNRALDATTYGAPQKQQKVFNAFGASLGGPVQIPRLYRGRNRTFFFIDFDGNRRPQTTLVQKLYPAAAARQGDLNGVPGGPAVDPLTGMPFPGNRIPTDRINAVATRLLDHYYPLPNVTSPGATYNYLALLPAEFATNGYDARVDHVINVTQRVFARWSWKTQESAQFWAPLPTSVTTTTYKSLVLAHTLTPSPRSANELRLGLGIPDLRENFPIRGRDAVADLGLVGLDLRNAGDIGGFPYFDFSDGTGYADVYHFRSQMTQSRNYQFTDTLSWVHGRHIAKFGADVRRIGYRATLHNGEDDDFGGYYFASGTFSGNAFADLLLGLPAQTYYAAVGPDLNQYATHAGLFAEDAWRISARLSVEAGLRWEVHPPLVEASGNITNFDHSNGNVIVPDHTIPPAPGFLAPINPCGAGSHGGSCTQILSASQVGLPQGLRTIDYTDWDPRLGFAWQPWAGGKTVVRGGAGIYTQTIVGPVAYALTGVHSSDVRTIDNMDADGRPLFTLPNILPAPNALGETGREDFFIGADPRLRDPRSYQWNLTVERALPWMLTLRASYVGVQSIGMAVKADINQIPASTQPFSVSRLPFQNWGHMWSVENIGFANYQGLQIEATRRLQGGVYFQGMYVHSKNVGATGSAGGVTYAGELTNSTATDRFNTRYDRGDLPGARRDRFLLTGIFPLPFGRGRRMGSERRGVPQAVLGGWELSTVSLVQSGPFLTPTMSPGLDVSNTDLAGRRVTARPDRFGNGNLADPARNQYFDRSAFAAPPKGAGRFGNSGAGVLVGPGTISIAAGLAKTFAISERLRLRLEGTFTNFPNHPNFVSPVTNISSPLFGKLTTVQSAENGGNRTGQVGMRLDF